MSLSTEVVFRRTDTGFSQSNTTLTVRDFADQSSVDTTGWTLTHIQNGIYELVVPLATEKSIYSLADTATGLITADGVLDIELTPSSIAESVRDVDNTSPATDSLGAAVNTAAAGGGGGGEGTGDLLWPWTEYQAGHNGDPNYVVPDVLVRVFTNDQGIGTPEASGRTDESGVVNFYLNAGTYYLFRRKSGRNFTNPVTVEVG